MSRRLRVVAEIPALFVWNELAEIRRLQEQREALSRRIEMLPRYSHKRIELQTRLKAITENQLKLQRQIRSAI